MDTRSVLLDIVKHTNGLDIIKNIKITGTETETHLAAMDLDKTVALSAKMHEPVADFKGEFGMGSLGLLSSLLRLSNYQDGDSTITISRKEVDGEEIPRTMLFQDNEGNKDQYNFMSKRVVDEAMRVGVFGGAVWQVDFQPTSKRIAHLSETSGIYSGIDPAFSVSIVDGELIFEVGSAESGIIGRRVFADDVEGKFTTKWSWPLKTFLDILKLGGTSTVRISDTGACQIEVDSGIAVYTYILLAATQ
jgi:hypothetical protein